MPRTPSNTKANTKANAKAVTIADIAREAGASQTTVSFVLNGHAEEKRIAESTARRVRDVARELRYAPNEMARSLRLQKTGDIGVILPHLLNDWAHHVMVGVEEVLDEAGFVPLIFNHRMDELRSRRGLESLVRRRVRGVLCSPMQHEIAHYRDTIGRGMPMAFLGDVPTDMPEGVFAAWDPAELAAPIHHLAEIGRRRVLFLGHTDRRRLTLERYDVVRKTLAACGLPADDSVFVLRPAEVGFERDLRELFSPHGRDTGPKRTPSTAPATRPDAIFALYDEIAMDAIDTLRSLGLRVPADVAVAATGTGLNASFRSYGLTLMKAPVAQEGAAAARLLLDLVGAQSGRPPGDAVRSVYVKGGELVPGETTTGRPGPKTDRPISSVGEVQTRPAA